MNKNNKGVKNALYYILVILAMVMVVYFLFGDNKSASPDIEYSTFTEQMQEGKIKNLKIQPASGVYKITGEYKEKQEVTNSGGLSIIGGGTESKT
ncbi:MAG: ATP-dependent metallopeptidase FtsH/Yme1/Tma family protein, partial [Enterococcus hulanensis]